MKTACHRLLLTLLYVAATPAFARPIGEMPEPPEPLPFELVVHPQHPQRPGQLPAAGKRVHIAPGQSLWLMFELKYTGTEPVTIFWGRSPYNSWVRLTIDTPGGQTLVTSYNDPELQPESAGEKEVVTLQQGETVRGRFLVGSSMHGVQQFPFRQPGDYMLTASVGLYEAAGDPKLAESWKLRGLVTAPEVSFHVDAGNAPQNDSRRVSGRVVDADGEPVARADVYIHVERTAMQSIGMEKRFTSFDRAVTDEQGQFEFPDFPAAEPRLMLGVIHRSLPPAHRIVDVDPATHVVDVEMSMNRGRTVAGTVVDPTGAPLAGVQVGRPPVPWKYLPGTAVTDAEGRFTIEGVATETASWIQAHRRDLEIVDKSNRLEAGDRPASMTIVMQPRDQDVVPLTGIARFDNGQPAGDLELTMWIDTGEEFWRKRQCVTTGDGRFTIELNHELAALEGPLRGGAEVARPPEQFNSRTGELQVDELGKSFSDTHNPRSRWMTAFEVPAEERQVELTFRREHVIRLKLTSENALPDELDVLVTLAMMPPSGFQPRCVASEMLAGNRLTDLDYRDLTPGRYELSVSMTLDRRFHFDDKWKQEVIIPPDGTTTEHEVAIAIPELHFGSVKVDVRKADGSKPFGLTSLWMDAHKAHGGQPVVNGVAHFPVVPAGPLNVSYSRSDGVTAVPLRYELAPGEQATLGPLVLRPIEELYGHVSGRVLLADGTPALGAKVNLDGFVPMPMVRGLGGVRIDADGRFRCSAPPPNRHLVVDLSACDLWPPGSATEKADFPRSGISGFGFGQTIPAGRHLVRPVQLVAGQEQAMDFVLPQVGFRDVQIELPIERGQHAHVALWSDLGPVQLQSTPVLDKGRATLKFVPDVPSQLIVAVWVPKPGPQMQQRYAAAIPVERGPSPVVRCDMSQAGQIRLRSVGGESSIEAVTYQVRPTDRKLPASLPSIAAVKTPLIQNAGQGETTGEDDEEVLHLAPGPYTVTATCAGVEREQTVELKSGDQQELIFDFAAPSGQSKAPAVP